MGIRRVPPDSILVFRGGLFAGSIQLSKQAMGKLTPEEWRPLLASAIAYYKNINTGMLRAMFPMFAIVLLYPFILVADFRFLDNAQFLILSYVVIGLLFVLLGTGFVLSLRRMKSLFFKADMRAAQLLGKERLVNSLMKMASIDQPNIVKRKGLIGPSPNERIDHLTEFSLQRG